MSAGAFTTPSECRAALDALLATKPRALRLYDGDLDFWLLDEAARHAALRSLCVGGGGQRIECLLDDASRVAATLPRFMQLIRDFGHVLIVREADPDSPRPDHACVLADRRHVLFRADKHTPQGTLTFDDPARAAALHQTFESLWQRAQAPLSATTLGL